MGATTSSRNDAPVGEALPIAFIRSGLPRICLNRPRLPSPRRRCSSSASTWRAPPRPLSTSMSVGLSSPSFARLLSTSVMVRCAWSRCCSSPSPCNVSATSLRGSLCARAWGEIASMESMAITATRIRRAPDVAAVRVLIEWFNDNSSPARHSSPRVNLVISGYPDVEMLAVWVFHHGINNRISDSRINLTLNRTSATRL